MTSEALLAFARSAVPSPAQVISTHVRNGRTIAHVSGGTGERFVAKTFATRAQYRAEVRAHRRWVPRIEGRAPALHRYDDEKGAVLLSHVDGAVPGVLRPALLRQAGLLARAFHGEARPEPDVAAHDVVWRDFPPGRVAKVAVLEPQLDLSWVPRLGEELRDVAAPGLVAAHGDFAPRNWLVDEHGTLRLVDFENAQRHVRGFDLARLALRLGPGRAQRMRAFVRGYDYVLSCADVLAFRGCLVRYAVGMLLWSHRHAHAPLRRSSLAVLEAVGREPATFERHLVLPRHQALTSDGPGGPGGPPEHGRGELGTGRAVDEGDELVG